MKKKLIRLASLLFVSLVFSCNSSHESGNTIIQEKKLNQFSALEVEGNIEIEWHPSDTYSMEIEVDENLAKDLELKIRNGVLKCRFTGSSTSADAYIKVYSPSLEVLSLSGNTRFEMDSTIVSKSFTFTSKGNASSELNIYTEKLSLVASGNSDIELIAQSNKSYIKTSGSADVDIEGLSKKSDFQLSGNSSIDADDYAIDSLIIGMSGNSNAEVQVLRAIALDASGNSHLKMEGKAKFYRQNLRNSAYIEGADEK